MNNRAAPGIVRDSILRYLAAAHSASIVEIREAVSARIGEVPASSVRSYLNLNTPELFERTARGHYKLRVRQDEPVEFRASTVRIGRATLVHSNCFAWLRSCAPH